MDGFHTSRGLHGERRDGRDAIAVLRREGFKIRGNARAGGWIETRDREHDGRSRIHVIGQFFEPLRDKSRPQTSGPAAQNVTIVFRAPIIVAPIIRARRSRSSGDLLNRRR